MAPIAKENEILSATPGTTARPSSAATVPADNASKQQPVALEVPVSVNGARTVEGSDKREPFSETTKTVLVFGSGAVIRLASSVTPGQLLFLTNEKTKKEVVCQVVKSKNYRNVSGYVELEFTESVVGFWGMRFPGDRLGSGPQPAVPAPAAVGSTVGTVTPVVPRSVPPAQVAPPSVAPKVELSPANLAPKVLEQKPAVPAAMVKTPEPKLAESKFVAPPASVTVVPPAPKVETPAVPATPASLMPDLAVSAPPVKPLAPISSTFDLPRTPDARASIFSGPPQAPVTPAALEVAGLSSVPEVGPLTHPAPHMPQLASASDHETAALKQQTARLQEQLSSLLFMESSATKPAENPPASPLPEKVKPAEVAAKILEFAKVEPAPVSSPARPVEPARIAPPLAKSLLDEEELKIPSWLEPLARNASAPTSTQELVEREKTKRLAEQPAVEEIATVPASVVEEELPAELQMPNFGNDLRIDASDSASESASGKSGKGLMFAAIAAGVLIVAGAGYWYLHQQSSGVPAAVAAASKQVPPVSAPAEALQPKGSAAAQTIPSAQTLPSVQGNSPLQTNSNLSPSTGPPAGAAYAPVNSKEVITNSAKPGTPSDVSASSQPLAVQPKKSSLGEVRLATPKVTQRRNAQDNGEAEAGLAMSGDESESNGPALGAGLVTNSRQPAAPDVPLPVGGDVKPAKLIASVPPIYPSLAKGQHISGDVRVDALIDPNGHVTTMKVVSGPTLLQQAAMDALHQWKYQPATLDGKPVQMHLTVTIQFRLQ
jgi:periplasmic protein TonB